MNVITRIWRRLAAAWKWTFAIAVFVPALLWFTFFDNTPEDRP